MKQQNTSIRLENKNSQKFNSVNQMMKKKFNQKNIKDKVPVNYFAQKQAIL